ncbi:branched-chain amino acid transport system substrate-binding protein [Rhodospirillales bacterium URHD0017]|nr:branched-chain amino acid transport system substrate-binding protein [Rhodospirillales bacterium URHD0017]
MSGQFRPSRRAMLKVGLAGAATVASPAILRLTAEAQTGPIKIGMPVALTGPLGTVGQQTKRGAEFWAKLQNAKGGILGRPIELLIEDTAGNPANCVRKAQEMVERRDCRLITGITLSSEALAVVPKLGEWDSIFISGINGDGRLTADSFVPNFFRANISGPMGTRAVSLYLRKSNMTKFYGLGLDYAWGHNSIGVFEDEVKRGKKEFVGKIFAPTGTKDYSPYITKIRQSGADAVFLVMQGDDNNAFLSQAQQYRLPEKVKLLTEIVDLASIRAVGDASLGLIGSSRYSFTYDQPLNNEFVAAWKKEYGNPPDTFEGEQWQCMKVLEAGIVKAGGVEAAKLRPALEDLEVESVKGKVFMRKCDHQGVQQGFMVEVKKKAGFDTPVPEVISTFPGDQTTPPCNAMTYKD